MLLIAALAIPVGFVSAFVAWALLELIGRITNAFFYHRASSGLIAPGMSHHPWCAEITAPRLHSSLNESGRSAAPRS
jgi:chloride channel protein, CIC family